MKTAIGRLSDRSNRHRVALFVVVTLALTVWGVTSLFDWSAALSRDQYEIVRRFVVRTGSARVAAVFNASIADGKLTVNEAKKVMEAAKEESPGYGLLSDQKNNK